MKGGMFQLVISLVAVAIAFIVFPIVIEGAEATRLATNLSSYTGMSSLIGIGPTLVFVVFILGGLTSAGFGAYKIARSRRGRR